MKPLFLFCGIIWAVLFLSSLYFLLVNGLGASGPAWLEIGRTVAYGFFAWLFLFGLRNVKIKW